MAYCTKCGATVPVDAPFCQKCGQPQKPVVPTDTPSRSGLSENTAALLSYVFGWLTGLIFLLIDKRPYVRFHAAQSLITFGGLHLVRGVVGMIFGMGWWFGRHAGMRHFGIGLPIFSLLTLLTLALWILCMVKAYQGQWFKVPLSGDVAEDIAGRQPHSRVGL
jgi:uncharacterized membrane protein